MNEEGDRENLNTKERHTCRNTRFKSCDSISNQAHGSSCEYHEAFMSTIAQAEEFMHNREAATINATGTLTVKVGPRNEVWTLQEMTDNFSKTEEWKRIRDSIYTVPNVELRSSKVFEPYESLEDLEQNMRCKYQDKINQGMTPHDAEAAMQKDKEYKSFETLQAKQSEIEVTRIIAKAFPGIPSLLLRSLESNRVVNESKMKNHSAFSALGFNLPNIGQQESDLMLVLLLGSKIFVRLIEVKRLGSKPWDSQSCLHQKPVNKALEQLEKGFIFLMGIMTDIPTENIDIKMLTCFPETSCKDVFCKDIFQNVIDKDNLATMTDHPLVVMTKLGIPNTVTQPTQAGLDLLLKICSRLVGKASLLHCGYRDLPDRMDQQKQRLSHTMKKMDRFIMLDKQQLSILDKAGEKKHFILEGPSGSGKTIIQLAVTKKMVNDSLSRGMKTCVLITAFHAEKDYELLSFFEEQTKDLKSEDQVEVKVLAWDMLLDMLDVKEDADDTPKTINDITAKLAQLHEKEGYEIILTIDELSVSSAPIDSETFDWTSLSPPTDGISMVFAFNPFPVKNLPMNPPNSKHFCSVLTKFRYRNTIKIQKCTACVGHDVVGFIYNERYATDIEGDMPMWIHLYSTEDEDGKDQEKKLSIALNNVKELVRHDTKTQVVLLHDSNLPQSIKDQLQKMAVTKSKGGPGWKVKHAEQFDGCECDTVVYVGNGYIEGFTRAKLKLFIITLEDDSFGKMEMNYYRALEKGVQKGLLKQISIDDDPSTKLKEIQAEQAKLIADKENKIAELEAKNAVLMHSRKEPTKLYPYILDKVAHKRLLLKVVGGVGFNPADGVLHQPMPIRRRSTNVIDERRIAFEQRPTFPPGNHPPHSPAPGLQPLHSSQPSSA
eukprot:GFUD01014749.1.p1 GENE.GFUD01014749.1~~GFUD01014749.1.p1  ORF type:complete len:885 (-),score=190.70 GFUD01014749.1:936-3590(-)